MIERWKNIPGAPGYSVSDQGRVQGPQVRTYGSTTPRGYKVVGVLSVTRTVHRLVAEAWVPNPGGRPNVHHIDGDKCNNRANNLQWVTQKEHATKHDWATVHKSK